MNSPGAPTALTLREALTRLARNRATLIAWPLVAALVALVGTFFLPDRYLAQAIVSVEQPLRRPGDPLVPLDTLIQNYRYLLRSEALHIPVLETLRGEGVELSPEQFDARVQISVPRESQFLFIGFLTDDPTLSARVSNLLAAAIVASVRDFNTAEVEDFLARHRADVVSAESQAQSLSVDLAAFQAERQLDLLLSRIEVATLVRAERESELFETTLALAQIEADPSAAELSSAEASRQSIRDEVHLEARISERQALFDRHRSLSQARAEAAVALEAASAGLDQLEADLADETRVISLQRGIEQSPLVQQILAQRSGVELEEVLPLLVSTEELNPVHAAVATDALRQRAEAERHRAEVAELDVTLAQVNGDIATLDEQINEGEARLAAADRAVELADAEYRALREIGAEGLRARARLLGDEVASLTASLEAMRAEHSEGTVQLLMKEQRWELAQDRVEAFTSELATARLTVLGQLPTLSVRMPAVEPVEPQPKRRKLILLAALVMGFAAALIRVTLREF